MQTLKDGTEVTSRGFYFLLDWSDNDDKQTIYGLYGVHKLRDLDKGQYTYLMKTAMDSELKSLGYDNKITS